MDQGVVGKRHRGQVALGAKGRPLSGGPFAPTKLDRTMNTSFFRVLLLQPCQVRLGPLVIEALALEQRLKPADLSLKLGYPAFQVCKLIFRKGKLLAQHDSRAVLCD
jgi:hypothetical protein